MHRVTIDAKNCYGINRLEHTLDFSNKNMPAVVYAPNGLMKTSLAKSIKDHIAGQVPKDLIYSDRESHFDILDESSEPISIDSLFVVDSINEKYQSDRISTLLASDHLKTEYEDIYSDIANKLASFLKSLAKTSGVKKDVESVFCTDLGFPVKEVITSFGRLEREVKLGQNSEFGEFEYKTLINEKVATFITKPDFAALIEQYTNTYENIIDSSKYFKKGVFNHSNAESIAKILKSNGWFEGGHTVRLNDGSGGVEILDEAQLAKAIEAEKNAILNNEELQASFQKVDNALSNAQLRDFRDYIIANPTLLPELQDYQLLKSKLWTGFLQKVQPEYLELLVTYDASKEKVTEILTKAEAEQTKWEKVLEIFNTRFSVPFRVAIENKGDAVLGINSPQIVFYFNELNGSEERKIEKSLLDRVLSNGEKRALYILNIIFEVEARRQNAIETLFVVDDIADSFDYRNKYAIVEYLADMRRDSIFHLIIMTHNFDFYRTIVSRLSIFGDNKLIATRTADRIVLQSDDFSANPFKNWCSDLSDRQHLIACVPFVRNLAEYTGDDVTFDKLTRLLHVKDGSDQITVSDLKAIFANVLPTAQVDCIPDANTSVLDLIDELCMELASQPEASINLHSKIVFAIGIRLLAEKVLISLIDDDEYVSSIISNQTGKLIRRFEKCNPGELVVTNLMRRVSLMTPENIHLNSFMFEPILDMSAHHLQSLFNDLKANIMT